MEDCSAGEIVINSKDRDGMMEGYDFDLVGQVLNIVKIPITVLGGAGSHKDISELINRFGILGASAGSFFVFKGLYKAVLIKVIMQKTDQNEY